MIDFHAYHAFDNPPVLGSITAPNDQGVVGGVWPSLACGGWGVGMNDSYVPFYLVLLVACNTYDNDTSPDGEDLALALPANSRLQQTTVVCSFAVSTKRLPIRYALSSILGKGGIVQ